MARPLLLWAPAANRVVASTSTNPESIMNIRAVALAIMLAAGAFSFTTPALAIPSDPVEVTDEDRWLDALTVRWPRLDDWTQRELAHS